jgi:hypothetical protein
VKGRDRRLKFFRRYDDGVVHLRVEQGVTLCGIDTAADLADYMTGPADAEGAPEPTCDVCAERAASPDLVAELHAAARRAGTRRRRLRLLSGSSR